MTPQKFRWSKVYESNEEELTQLLNTLKLETVRWTADEYEELNPAKSENPITIWCAEGSLSVGIEGVFLSIQPGDGLRVPENASLEMRAGISGCVCYQAISK